ncbi:hypothetical protein [Neomoorella mulderi]|uniref:Uncharacterized protein n=1 Tax=Moorella mulderi DSM 14980 TaxID=1122241 RepID=A0A151AVF3_9FIRM|nr:hypothetical protein [Moorella mulderi]KYH31618.1 hypothetical protein MOMUL_21740 [Moorella mulderi DSM 14980]
MKAEEVAGLGGMVRAQFTLTVPEGKLLIARAIAALPDVRRALETGRILLKGGTTVSAVAEQLAKVALRISGRVTPRGTKAAWDSGDDSPHSIILEKGSWRNIDGCFAEEVASLSLGDVAVLGANALDPQGRAAMMAGSLLGGNPGRALSGLMAQGVKVFVACGLEKLIPGPVDEAIKHCGLTGTSWSMGMAVGLMPVVGHVVTEREAVEILSGAICTVIGRGGINGAEGATTMVAEGDEAKVQAAISVVLDVKGACTSGSSRSMEECRAGCPKCREHRSCAWRKWSKSGFEKRQ